MKMKLNWKLIFNISMFAFSGGLLVYFGFSENGLVDLVQEISTFDKTWLSLAIFFQLLNILIDAFLIYLFAKNFVGRYTFRNALKTGMVGQFFSAVTPGASGGQPMQVYLMVKQRVDPGVATSALVQKFLVYQSTLTAYSAFAILVCFPLFSQALNGVMWALAIFGFAAQALVIVLLLLFSFNKKITYRIISGFFYFLGKIKLIKKPQENIERLENHLAYFHESNKELYKKPKLVLQTYLLCALQLSCMFVVPYCIYRCFHLSGARMLDMICTQAFVSMVSSFVPLPGASGASEGSFYMFFGLYFTENTIKAAILLWRIITYYLVIVISLPFSRLTKIDKTPSGGV